MSPKLHPEKMRLGKNNEIILPLCLGGQLKGEWNKMKSNWGAVRLLNPVQLCSRWCLFPCLLQQGLCVLVATHLLLAYIFSKWNLELQVYWLTHPLLETEVHFFLARRFNTPSCLMQASSCLSASLSPRDFTLACSVHSFCKRSSSWSAVETKVSH